MRYHGTEAGREERLTGIIAATLLPLFGFGAVDQVFGGSTRDAVRPIPNLSLLVEVIYLVGEHV